MTVCALPLAFTKLASENVKSQETKKCLKFIFPNSDKMMVGYLKLHKITHGNLTFLCEFHNPTVNGKL